MIKIGIVGDIGSGKSYIAKQFGFPVFNADNEVSKIYKYDKRFFNKLMIKIGILGDIGSGKSFVAKQFGYPVFDADKEVSKIYKKSSNCFKKLKKKNSKIYFIISN